MLESPCRFLPTVCLLKSAFVIWTKKEISFNIQIKGVLLKYTGATVQIKQSVKTKRIGKPAMLLAISKR